MMTTVVSKYNKAVYSLKIVVEQFGQYKNLCCAFVPLKLE